MKFDLKLNGTGIDWQTVSETLKSVGMAYREAEIHQRAFEASHTTVFAYHGGQLIGFGRAISDDVYQAAIYDCAVVQEFQGKGIGTAIMEKILEQVSHCTVILYASPGKEGFYQAHGFRKMKTGMARFKKSLEMKELGFTE